MNYNFKVLDEIYCVCKLNNNVDIPSWVDTSKFYSITKTNEELSIVCNQQNIPSSIKAEKDWRILKIDSKLDFYLVGIISKISDILAQNNISIFVISTFDTDYIMVKKDSLEKALRVLSPLSKV